MSILLIQGWDIVRGKEDAYDEFVNQFIFRSNKLGLTSVGGFYVEVGFGPRIISVKRAETVTKLHQIMMTDTYKDLVLDLQEYIINYRNAVLAPTGCLKSINYRIQKGVWKYMQHWSHRADKRTMYDSFMNEEYLPALDKIDYLEVTGIWDVLIGVDCQIICELTFKSPVDIGRLLDNPEFRQVNGKLRRNFICNYSSRIIRTTERFDEPRWYRL